MLVFQNSTNSLLSLKLPNASPISRQNLIFKNISFANISYSYPKTSRNVFNNINLEFKAGDKIGIYGPSGSGKSTFINIIMTLLAPTEGQIKVNSKKLDPKRKTIFILRIKTIFHIYLYSYLLMIIFQNIVGPNSSILNKKFRFSIKSVFERFCFIRQTK